MRPKVRNIGADEDASAGIWYYVWLPHRWVLMVWPDEKLSHWEAWGEKLVPILIEDWGIKNKSDQDVLKGLQHSIPRGRVIEDRAGNFILAHGNDFPSGTDQKNEIGKIISALGLTRRYLIGQVTDGFASHETMSPSDQVKLQNIIGPIPY